MEIPKTYSTEYEVFDKNSAVDESFKEWNEKLGIKVDTITKLVFLRGGNIIELNHKYFDGINLKYQDLFIVLIYNQSDVSVDLFSMWKEFGENGGAAMAVLNIDNEEQFRKSVFELTTFHPSYWLKRDFRLPMILIYRDGFPQAMYPEPIDNENLEEVKRYVSQIIENGGIIEEHKPEGYEPEEQLDTDKLKALIDQSKELSYDFFVRFGQKTLDEEVISDLEKLGIQDFVAKYEKTFDEDTRPVFIENMKLLEDSRLRLNNFFEKTSNSGLAKVNIFNIYDKVIAPKKRLNPIKIALFDYYYVLEILKWVFSKSTVEKEEEKKEEKEEKKGNGNVEKLNVD